MGDLSDRGPGCTYSRNARVPPRPKHNIKAAFGNFFGADIQPCVGRVIHVDHRKRHLYAGGRTIAFGKYDRLASPSRTRARPHWPALFEIREQQRLPLTDPDPVIAKFPQDLAVQSESEKQA